MVAKTNGKGPVVKKGGANKPSGKPVAQQPKVIMSPYTMAKKAGGSANAGSGIGNG